MLLLYQRLLSLPRGRKFSSVVSAVVATVSDTLSAVAQQFVHGGSRTAGQEQLGAALCSRPAWTRAGRFAV